MAIIQGTDGNDQLRGTGGDTVYGGLGDDILSAEGTGEVALFGEAGDDILQIFMYSEYWTGVPVEYPTTFVDGGEGTDGLSFGTDFAQDWIGATIDLTNGLVTFGDPAIPTQTVTGVENAEGFRGDDTITGTAEANVLRGAFGNDLLRGRGGDDVMSGDWSRVGHRDGNDTLNGGAGADRMSGQGGDDTLRGGSGADRLVGGPGQDVLVGGTGDDTFVFASQYHSSGRRPDTLEAGATADAVEDPGRRAGDIIDLSGIDANSNRGGDQAFHFGTDTDAGRLWARNVDGDTVVRGNVDGDARAEFALVIEDGDVRASDYSAGDFYL